MSFTTLLSLLVALVRAVPPLAAAAYRLAKVFWSVAVVVILVLKTVFDGNYTEALALFAGALGLGQVLHQTNKTTLASELAQLAAGAAKAQAEALRSFLEKLGETIKPPTIFQGPPAVEFERVNQPLPAYASPTPKGPSGPRYEDLRGDGQAHTSMSVRRDG